MKRLLALLWFAALATALADGGGQGDWAKSATRWGAMLVVERVSKVFENAIGEAPPELKGKRPVVFEVLRRKSPGPGPESWPPAMLEALGGRQEVCIAAYRSDGVLHWVLYSTEQPPALLGVFRRESADAPWIRCPDTIPQPDAVEEDRVPAVGIDSRRSPTTMVEEPGVSEAAGALGEIWLWSPVVGAKAEEGKVAFMGFDFGKEVEWEPGERSVPGDGPGSCLVRKFVLASPWHGFKSVLAWGDVKTRLPIALFFERFVPNGEPDSSKEDARRWFEEVLAAFPEECGVELDGGMFGAGYGEASGKTGGLEVRVFTAGCAPTRAGLPLRNGEPEPGTVWGRLYKVRVRVESAAAELEGF